MCVTIVFLLAWQQTSGMYQKCWGWGPTCLNQLCGITGPPKVCQCHKFTCAAFLTTSYMRANWLLHHLSGMGYHRHPPHVDDHLHVRDVWHCLLLHTQMHCLHKTELTG